MRRICESLLQDLEGVGVRLEGVNIGSSLRKNHGHVADIGPAVDGDVSGPQPDPPENPPAPRLGSQVEHPTQIFKKIFHR